MVLAVILAVLVAASLFQKKTGGGVPLSMAQKTRADFARRFLEAARTVNMAGINPNMALSVAGLETGWGTGNVFHQTNSLFNIKATPSWSGRVFETKNSDGTVYFRAYPTLAASVTDWVRLISTGPRYKKAYARALAEDYHGFFKELQAAGYAGDDSLYSQKLAGALLLAEKVA